MFGAASQSSAIYSNGNGYIAELGNNWNDSIATIESLMDSNWTDARTRSLFIEFFLYNPSTALYTLAMLNVEVSPSELRMTQTMEPIWLSRYEGVNGGVYMFTDVTALIVMAIFVIVVLVQLCKNAHDFCQYFWNQYDVFTCVVCIVTAVLRGAFIANLLIVRGELDDGSVQFSVLNITCALSQASLVMVALLVFLITLRFAKLLRFHRLVKMIARVWQLVRGKVIVQAIFCVAMLLIFVATCFLMNSSTLHSYSTFTKTLQSLVGAFVGEFSTRTFRNSAKTIDLFNSNFLRHFSQSPS